MQLPKWVIAWLEGERVNVEDFLTFLKEKAKEIDVPSDLIDAVSLWVQENVTQVLSPAHILAFATLVVTELRSGHPGYDSEHGGLV